MPEATIQKRQDKSLEGGPCHVQSHWGIQEPGGLGNDKERVTGVESLGEETRFYLRTKRCHGYQWSDSVCLRHHPMKSDLLRTGSAFPITAGGLPLKCLFAVNLTPRWNAFDAFLLKILNVLILHTRKNHIDSHSLISQITNTFSEAKMTPVVSYLKPVRFNHRAEVGER